jgi:AcrR family transcriptional regulator
MLARVKDWIPVARSAKGRLALVALEEFGARGYGPVSLVDLAAKAGVTTGSLYHHYRGKPGLFQFVRIEAERRVLDRMEGAAAARSDDDFATRLRSVLLIGFDVVVEHGLIGIMADSRSREPHDPIEELLARLLPVKTGPVTARMVGAAWRAALAAVADGAPAEQARSALASLRVASP